MEFVSPRSRVPPEFVPAYTVSEVESPRPWDKVEQERADDRLSIEEVFIAPPLPRRPDYHNHQRYRARRSNIWAPPPTPSALYREGYEGERYRGYDEHPYDCDRRPEGYWGRRSPAPSLLSDDSSVCSAPECEECAYIEPRGHCADRSRGRPIPYMMVPGHSIGPMPTSAPHVTGHPYIREAPRVHHLYDSTELEYIGAPPPTRELSIADGEPLASDTQNQMVLYQGPANNPEREQTRSDEHSNVSSPRWSVGGQRYLSGSETRSDMHSHSPVTSFDGSLYGHPDPRFAHHVRLPMVHMHHAPPVVITRSDPSYEYEYDDGYSDVSGSDGRCSESERSFSSGSGYYSDEYDRRYW